MGWGRYHHQQCFDPFQIKKNGQRKTRQRGFSLIEIVIVIALIGSVYVLAMPDFSSKSASEMSSSITRLNSDFRSAFDLAVLSGKPFRLVFKIRTGDYWLESTDKEDPLTLGQGTDAQDPTAEEQKAQEERFEEDFSFYKDMGEHSVQDPKGDAKFTTASPVLEAKDRLKPPKWKMYESSEWGQRNLYPLGIRAVYAEHHTKAVSIDDSEDPDALAFIYVMPQGYLEKAVLYLYPKLDESTLDLNANPYKVYTLPNQGEARYDSVSRDQVDLTRLDGP